MSKQIIRNVDIMMDVLSFAKYPSRSGPLPFAKEKLIDWPGTCKVHIGLKSTRRRRVTDVLGREHEWMESQAVKHFETKN
jgi:hypothetical protein